MADPRPKVPASKETRLRTLCVRALREAGVLDRNRFAALDRRMMPDRLLLPEPIAALLRGGR